MANGNWSENEETMLAEYLVARVCDRASGRSEAECLRNYPRDVYFIGNLRPRAEDVSDDGDQPGHLRELLTKMSPVAFGAEFLTLVEADAFEVDVTLNWSCYYRVFPTLEQQRIHQRQTTTASTSNALPEAQLPQQTAPPTQQSEDDSTVEQAQEDQSAESDSPEVSASARDRRRTRIPHDSLFIRFRKISCHAVGSIAFRRGVDDAWSGNADDLRRAVTQEIDRARQQVMTDTERIRTNGRSEDQVRVPETALASEEAYEIFLRSLHSDVMPNWRWEVRSELWTTSSGTAAERVVAIEFINVSPMADNVPNTEAFLFDCEAVFTFRSGEVRPFELELAPRSFRFDRDLWGRGINCAIERMDSSEFQTTHTPIYRQMRYATRTTPPAPFADLAQNPMPVLDAILIEMRSYRRLWEQARQDYVAADSSWESQFGVEFDRDQQIFEEEIERFWRGFELIRTNADVRTAFQLTNETFRRGPKSEWRLFQIVFLVSQLPGVAALTQPNSAQSEEREYVDIIYFPTGGGKTEAYLAIIIFHCFFDRLRGKSAGVTAWTRFPLRLLTLQQTQRVADVLGTAELLRQEQNDPRLIGPTVDGFAVGYFVGEGGSPNEVADPGSLRDAGANVEVTWSRANDPDERQKWKRVARCPACRTSTVRVDFEPSNVRVFHRCTRPNCAFPNGEIPIYIVDNEIYRYLPCVIVGTIDKLAGIGNQRKFSLILGQVDGICSLHGYYKGKCCQKDCNDPSRLRPMPPRGLSGPTLFVQDELHLLKEGLGTFDSHYETFIQRLQYEFGQHEHLKIIASSATVEAFERQVEHLYGRAATRARRFPGDGPVRGQSFYADTQTLPQRLYIGLIPHNKTIFNTILELVEAYHRELEVLLRFPANTANPYGGTVDPGSSEWGELLDLWRTSLTYFLANRELNSIRTDIEGDVIPHLQRDGFSTLEISELTGGTVTDEVSRILEKLERPALATSSPDTILANVMVSHGVDIDRLNAMIFYGMPRQNAEYIQASSRVGRTHVGLVFTCLHPVRERDQSHYAYFVKFHEFLGQLVEPVAINRWSKFSINRTLPGLFMGVLLQLIANQSGESNPNRYYMLDFVRQKISDGSLRPEHFIPLLEEAYQVQTVTGVGETVFRDEIRVRVRQYLDWILSAGAGKTFVSEVLIPQPMRSLRDVDEVINIELDSVGSQWAARAGR